MAAKNSKLVRFIKKWRIPFALLTAGLYATAIVLLVVVFPDVSNLWVSVFVLVSGFTAALTTVSDLLVSSETDETSESIENP